jgi:hypothetical protein
MHDLSNPDKSPFKFLEKSDILIIKSYLSRIYRHNREKAEVHAVSGFSKATELSPRLFPEKSVEAKSRMKIFQKIIFFAHFIVFFAYNLVSSIIFPLRF